MDNEKKRAKDVPIKLSKAVEDIPYKVDTLRRSYINPYPNQQEGDDHFDPTMLNIVRYSTKGKFYVRPSEVKRFIKEACKK